VGSDMEDEDRLDWEEVRSDETYTNDVVDIFPEEIKRSKRRKRQMQDGQEEQVEQMEMSNMFNDPNWKDQWYMVGILWCQKGMEEVQFNRGPHRAFLPTNICEMLTSKSTKNLVELHTWRYRRFCTFIERKSTGMVSF